MPEVLTLEMVQRLTSSLTQVPCPEELSQDVFMCLPNEEQSEIWVGKQVMDLVKAVSGGFVDVLTCFQL
jgi:hypothetical protein